MIVVMITIVAMDMVTDMIIIIMHVCMHARRCRV